MINITIPSSVSPKLKKLVLMLSSPREAANAAGAIERTLHSIGSDWHGLAGLLTETHQRHEPDTDHSDYRDSTDWHAMRELCLDHQYLLRPREMEFVISLDRWRGNLTEKQHDWLVAIHTRVRRATA